MGLPEMVQHVESNGCLIPAENNMMVIPTILKCIRTEQYDARHAGYRKQESEMESKKYGVQGCVHWMIHLSTPRSMVHDSAPRDTS